MLPPMVRRSPGGPALTGTTEGLGCARALFYRYTLRPTPSTLQPTPELLTFHCPKTHDFYPR